MNTFYGWGRKKSGSNAIKLAGLNENSNQSIYIYPNPTNNLIYVSGLNDFSFEIVDLKGRILSSGRNANIISIEDFAYGIYVLNLENNGFIKKFFVVKE